MGTNYTKSPRQKKRIWNDSNRQKALQKALYQHYVFNEINVPSLIIIYTNIPHAEARAILQDIFDKCSQLYPPTHFLLELLQNNAD